LLPNSRYIADVDNTLPVNMLNRDSAVRIGASHDVSLFPFSHSWLGPAGGHDVGGARLPETHFRVVAAKPWRYAYRR